MLRLNRAKNKKVMIGDDIEVIFLGMDGHKAQLGFIAPKSIPVHREEIYSKIKQEKMAKGAKL